MVYTNRYNYLIRLTIDICVISFVTIKCFDVNNLLTVTAFSSFNGENIIIVILNVLAWYIGARIFHLYNEVIFYSFSQEMISLIKALAVHLFFIIFIIFFLIKDPNIFRETVLLYNGILMLVIPVDKYLYRLVTAYLRKNRKQQKNIIIVGADSLSSDFYHSAISNNNFRYTIAGVVDDEKRDSLNGMYLGNIDLLEDILTRLKIDEVFIGLSGTAYDKANDIIDICEKKGKRVSILADKTKLSDGAFKVTNYAGFPVVSIRYYPLDDPENKFFKRLFDIVCSLLFLGLIAVWLFPIVALIIKLTSKGRVFFKQERWGLNNKKIVCFKFRTMYTNCNSFDEHGIYLQAKRNDKRITPFGKFLRATSIDEMPQFVNVLLGNMSLVGPRPHPIPLTILSKDIVHNYMLRHIVKPGITGWAQVNGSRGETRIPGDMQKRIDFDLWYIENWSIWLDCQIFFQTIINFLKGDDKAY